MREFRDSYLPWAVEATDDRPCHLDLEGHPVRGGAGEASVDGLRVLGRGIGWTDVSGDRFRHGSALASLVNAWVAATDRSHLILHAASVVVGGRAWLIAGPSRSGKSSLAVGIGPVVDGLLSDEASPIHVRSGRVHHFPRSLWLKRSSLASLGLADAAAAAARDGTHFLQPEAAGVRSWRDPVRPGGVVFLSREQGTGWRRIPSPETALRLLGSACQPGRFGPRALTLVNELAQSAPGYRLEAHGMARARLGFLEILADAGFDPPPLRIVDTPRRGE
jgi:hypothetical protein